MPAPTYHQPSAANEVDTVYLLSAGRSGSTLLNLLLGLRPDATALSELTHLPKNLADDATCSCGSNVSQCEFWRGVVRKLEDQLHLRIMESPYTLNLGFIGETRSTYYAELGRSYRRAWKLRHLGVYLGLHSGIACPRFLDSAFRQSIDNTMAAFAAVRELTGAPIVIDASKGYLKGIRLYLRRPLQTRLVLLTRDGRASFFSRLRDGYPRVHSVRAWRNYYARVLPLVERRVDPADWTIVRYEDLVENPGKELGQLCDRLGLPNVPVTVDLSSKVQHITSGNDMRLRTSQSIRLDNSWREQMSAADAGYFARHAGKLNKDLGYH